MANDKKFVVKRGLATPNVDFANGGGSISATFLSTSNTLSFSGNTGQLFSITDSMSGTIFSVNDISGIPSIEVIDTGAVKLAETFGSVAIGANTVSNFKFNVSGNTLFGNSVTFNSTIIANGAVGTSGFVLTSNGTGVYWAAANSSIASVATANNATFAYGKQEAQLSVANAVFADTANNALRFNGKQEAQLSVAEANTALFLQNRRWETAGAIGSATANTGAFTSLTASANVNLDSGTLFTDATTNRVGVGTITPNTQFHMSSSSADGTVMMIEHTNSNKFPSIIFNSFGGSAGDLSAIVADTRRTTGDYGAALHGLIYRSGRASLGNHSFLNSANTVQMVITESGNVAIGSNSAPTRLFVNGHMSVANGFGFFANGTLGANGLVLTSNGSSLYWGSVSASGGGFTGNTVSANSTIIRNQSYAVNAAAGWVTMTLPSTVTTGDIFIVHTYGGNTRILNNSINIMDIGTGNDLVLENGETVWLQAVNATAVDVLFTYPAGGTPTIIANSTFATTANNALFVYGKQESQLSVASSNTALFLQNRTWETAGAIGATVANTGAFTTLTTTGSIQQQNANYLSGRNSSGGSTRLFGINSANTLYVGAIDTQLSETLFVNNGVEQMRIQSSGNVSIGSTITPTRLFVNGHMSIANGFGLFANGTLGANGLILTSNGTSLFWGSIAAAANATFSTTANNALFANSASFVYGKQESQLSVAAANTALFLNGANSQFYTNATNIITGTLAEARLPFRMNQNVRTTDDVIFANGTFTGTVSIGGNLVLTGNLISQNIQSLSVIDPLIKLGVNNASDAIWGGFTFHYSGSGNTTNHAGLVRSPTTKEFILMSTFGDETAVANNNTININDSSFTYANLQVNFLRIGNNTNTSTLSVTNYTGTANNATFAYGKQESQLIAGTATTANNASFLNGRIWETAGAIGSTVANTGAFTTLTASANVNLDSGTLFTDATNNRVGINNTNPTASLHVQGATLIGGDGVNSYDFRLQRLNSGVRAVQHDFSASANSPWILHGENLLWTGERAGTVESTQAFRPYYEAFAPVVGYKEFGFANVTSGNFTGTNLIPNMVLTNTGRVGVGTTNPITPFVVSNAGADGLEFDGSTGLIQSYNRSTSAYQTMLFDAATMVFRPSGTEAARITATGNVAIGSTAAPTRLFVNGHMSVANGFGIFANGTLGANGLVLTSNGTSLFWGSVSADSASTANNASFLAGRRWETAGAIGSATSNTGTFTTLTTTQSGGFANTVTATTGQVISHTTMNGGRTYFGYDLNTQPALYETRFVNISASTNIPSGMSSDGYWFGMGAGDTTNRGFSLMGTTSHGLWFRTHNGGSWIRTVDTTNIGSLTATLAANNASFLNGRIWETAGAIGSTVANTGVFTTLTARPNQTGAIPAVQASNNTIGMYMVPNAGSGAYNNLVSAGDNLIYFSNNTINGGNLVIGAWSDRASGYGIRFSNAFSIAVVSNTFVMTANTIINGNTLLNGNVNIDSSTLFVDATTNRVGIGTSSPILTELQVVGHTHSSTGVSIGTDAGRFTPTGFGTTTPNSGMGSNASSVMALSGFNGITFYTNATTQRLRIDAGGNVSIGTTDSTPTRLFVNGHMSVANGFGIFANGTLGANGLVLTSNGTSLFWGSVSAGGGTTTNAVTFNNGGSGAASGTTFDGSAARTISYNTVGAPSTTGTNASGNWGINVTGSSASAGLVTGTSGQLQAHDIRTIAPSAITAPRAQFGFTSFNNNNTSPYADFFHLRSYSDSSGGNDNLVMFRKDAIGMRIYQQTYGSATNYASFKDIAFTDGTNASGSWGISVTGSSASTTGNAATATALQTARTIGGVSFNGTANIDLPGVNTAGNQNTSGTAASTPNPTFSADAVTKDDITTRTDTGFYQSSSGTTAEGWPTDSNGWHHLISATHSNDGNYFALQLSSRFDTQNLYFRNTNGSGTTAWSTLLHSGNFNSYSPTLTGGGASGSWGINITGTAPLVSRTVAADAFAPLVEATIGTNDFFRIGVGGGSNAGYVEIATADDGTEPIFVRQYTGTFTTLARTATILDTAGNTQFPGTLSAAGSFSLTGSRPLAYGASGGTLSIQGDSGGWATGLYFLGSGGTNLGGWGGLGGGNALTYLWAGTSFSSPAIEVYTTGQYAQSPGSFRAPIFYDSNNTAYYMDPLGTTNLLGNLYVARSGVSNDTFGGLEVREYSYAGAATGAANEAPGINFHWSLRAAARIYMNGGGHFVFAGQSDITNNRRDIYFASSYAATDSRAPIFYDSNNTAFFFDGASTTNINTLNGNGKQIFNTGDSYLRINEGGAFSNGCWFGGSLLQGGGFYTGSNGGTTNSRVAIIGGTFNGTNVITLDGSNGRITASEIRIQTPPTSSSQLNIGGYNAYGGTGYNGFLTIYNSFGSATNPYQYWRLNSAGGWEIVNSAYNAVLFTFTQGGDFTAVGNVTAYSDRKLKDNFEPISDAVNKVLQLNGVTFTRIDKDDTTQRYAGLIAQDVESVLPEAVQKNDTMSYGEVLSVDYNATIALLVEAIKEQQAHINRLEQQINSKRG